MVKYTREEYKKNLFSFKNGWGDDKRNKKYKKSTWKLAMQYVDRLLKETDIPKPVILPYAPNCIDLDWSYYKTENWHLLINVAPNPTDVGYYGGGNDFQLEVEGQSPPEDFETAVNKIINWYKKIKKD